MSSIANAKASTDAAISTGSTSRHVGLTASTSATHDTLIAASPPVPGSSRHWVAAEQRVVERDAVVREPLREPGANPGALQLAEELAVGVDPHRVIEHVEVLEHDHVALHPHHLADVRHPPRPVP